MVESESLLTEEKLKKRLSPEIWEFINIFRKKKIEKLPSHQKYDHKIDLKEGANTSLRHCPLYAMSPFKLQKVKKYLKKMLSKEFISFSKVSFASSILFAQKVNGGLRFCVNYCKLNALIKKNCYPILLIHEIMTQLSGKKWFTQLNIVAAFNNLQMHSDSVKYTTFKTLFDMYQYNVLPFGLTEGFSSLQYYMNDILFEFLDKFCSVYLDDILIYSNSLSEHKEHVHKVLTAIQAADLQIDIDKSEFYVQKTHFLDVIVGVNGIKMDPIKIKAIVQWATPRNLKEVQSFLDFCNFYRQFIQEFTKLADSLTKLTRKEVPFH